MKIIISDTERNQIRFLHEQFKKSKITQGNPLVFSSVMDFPNKPKGELYDKIKLWLSQMIGGNRYELDDEKNGIIIYRGVMRFIPEPDGLTNYGSWWGTIAYSLKFQIKDFKVKLEMMQMYHEGTDAKTPFSLFYLTDANEFKIEGYLKNQYNSAWQTAKNEMKSYFEEMKQSISQFLNKNLLDDFKP